MQKITLAAYKIPCEIHESDGTFEWDSTTIVVVSIKMDQWTGMGFSYGHEACLDVIKNTLSPHLKQIDVQDLPSIFGHMKNSVRNIGLHGIAAHAISAVDIALWDLKAKILDKPLCQLWGKTQDKIPIYGSGGFTSESPEKIARQFLQWKEKGVFRFKMKIGREPSQDFDRVKKVRGCLDASDEIFVDANGAYQRKQSLDFAKKFKELGVTWFEEPVPADDLEGLKFIKDNAEIAIASGEYGYDPVYFKNMLQAQAVDILQADATRCCGFTGFLQICHLSKAFNIPLSSHTAPSIHLHAALSDSNVCHMEFFHDHVQIEEKYFEGFPLLKDGFLFPHLQRRGHGLELREKEIEKHLIREEILCL